MSLKKFSMFILFITLVLSNFKAPAIASSPFNDQIYFRAESYLKANQNLKALELYIRGYKDSPQDQRFKSGIIKAQKKLFNQSIGKHRMGYYSTAIKGYKAIIYSPPVEKEISLLASKNKVRAAKKLSPLGYPLRYAKEIPVLTYHHLLRDEENVYFKNNPSVLSVQNFEEQIKTLYENGYATITLKELEEFVKGQRKLPEKSVLITFDDGYLSNYVYAYPGLKKYGYTAAIFMITKKITEEPVKFDRDKTDGFSWGQIEASKDVFEFGGHTHALHAFATNGKALLVNEPANVVNNDLRHSKNLLNTDYFAYPYGIYNQETITILKNAGYEMAFTVQPGKVKPGDKIYELKRFGIYPSTSLEEFKNFVGISK